MASARLSRVLPVIVVVLAMVPVGGTAHASFPGTNGPIAYAFVDSNTFCPDIYKVNADGTGNLKLTNCPEIATDPSWNADGSKLAFTSSESGGGGGPQPSEIYTIAANGAGKVRVTNDSIDDDDPSWSNDGTKIVEGRTRSGPDTKDIAVVDATGGVPANLITTSPGSEADEPEYSPDGTKIVFQKKSGPTYDVLVMNADGSNQVDLTTGSNANDAFPAWDPAGAKIYFASDRFGNYEIFSMNAADGTGLVQITDEPAGVNDIQPAPSPDGAFVAFTQGCTTDDCTSGGGSTNGDIKKIELSTTTVTTVVASTEPEYSPDWGLACTSNCGPPPPTHVTRTLSLAFKGSLKATGVLNETTGQNPQCGDGQKVKIQKKTPSEVWDTVKTATTTSTGAYAVAVPNRSGTYRAVAPKVDRTQIDGLICDPATSKTRTYSVIHPRAFVRFFASADPDHGGMSFLIYIKSLDAFDDCVVDVPVQVQRKSGSSWTTVKTVKTSRAYEPHQGTALLEHQTARAGTYRAFAPKITMRGGDHDGDVCKPATSKTDPYP